MKNAEMKIIHFGESDVIATSGGCPSPKLGLTANSYWLKCDALSNNQLYLDIDSDDINDGNTEQLFGDKIDSITVYNANGINIGGYDSLSQGGIYHYYFGDNGLKGPKKKYIWVLQECANSEHQ